MPVRSRETRRIKVARSAQGAGASFSFSRRARTKASMGLRGQDLSRTEGNAARFGGRNAQCVVAGCWAAEERITPGSKAPARRSGQRMDFARIILFLGSDRKRSFALFPRRLPVEMR